MRKWVMKAAGIMVALFVLPMLITVIVSRPSLKGRNSKQAKETYGKSEMKDTTYTVDDYIMMAMAANIDLSMNMETLKAQAVIIRTTIYEKLQGAATGDLSLDELGLDVLPLEQLKKQLSKEAYNTAVSNLENAIFSTRGLILAYDGKPIKAYFHYANTGRTRSYEEAYGTSIPYLVSVESKKDVQSEVGITTKEYKKSEFLAKLKAKYTINEVKEDNLLDSIELKEKEKTGYVHTLCVGKVEISGEAFRDIFELNSTNFYMEEKEGAIRIVCRGKGSGLGFSQYGANLLADTGMGYKELLTHYYKGAELSEVSK